MKTITVKAGPTNQMNIDVEDHLNARQVANLPRVLAGLAVSANMRIIIDGVEQGDSSPVRHGDILHLENRASSKQ